MGADRIPDKLFFRIGEVSEIVDVKPYVLRYWESEFDLIAPEKSNSRQRLYQRKDLELLLEIKRLLYDEGFTIAGARKKLKQLSSKNRKNRHSQPAAASQGDSKLLALMQRELQQIKEMLRTGQS
ncbi:MAG: MerR family transcriptional regulator [Deltaproteobacteria bacterium]|nr:MerR family transcriptional regulator [Deltaproteobacteria bacterium]